MIGIDITRVSRFVDAKTELVKKVLHPSELVEYEKSTNKAYFLASRWAIKEAIFKADNTFCIFNEFAIIKDKNNAYKFAHFQISTATEDDYYVAMVIKDKHDTKK